METRKYSKAGMGLTHALIAASLISVTSVGLTSMIGLSTKATGGAFAANEAAGFESFLNQILQSRLLCKKGLEGQPVAGQDPRIYSKIFDGGFIKAGSRYGRYWRVGEIKLPQPEVGDDHVIGKLKVSLVKRREYNSENNHRAFGAPEHHFQIPVVLNLAATGLIKGCSQQLMDLEESYETTQFEDVREGTLLCCGEDQVLISGYWKSAVGGKNAHYAREPGEEKRCIRMFEGNSTSGRGNAELFCMNP